MKMTLLYGFNVIFQNALLHLEFDIPLQQLLRSVCTVCRIYLPSVKKVSLQQCPEVSMGPLANLNLEIAVKMILQGGPKNRTIFENM